MRVLDERIQIVPHYVVVPIASRDCDLLIVAAGDQKLTCTSNTYKMKRAGHAWLLDMTFIIGSESVANVRVMY